jgi:hypothetical protein
MLAKLKERRRQKQATRLQAEATRLRSELDSLNQVIETAQARHKKTRGTNDYVESLQGLAGLIAEHELLHDKWRRASRQLEEISES